ncbi:hypothetical protein TBLA_0A08520 [Henningerozyma blattae CBS 6284]|uniref:Major facilitator superfamily (MFS) profile domain-containing protein n=1 Tax=Henningerozyma blattae (strain ATCC 34711 / CBS 6284 / DSM 70876 / NBRC 10599 / NRRL Y-10934 / UCD 77-7) TaxID=1071380 RepID=I2GWZ0_HENB6|nr:hypothetical protein TBLA_0A08520 [Tetrapisispora blattae CBS 6284]CCH58642.1 hypothetical protein TBLA_0A08520 [Tetrapisispora blattae CBS 6284]
MSTLNKNNMVESSSSASSVENDTESSPLPFDAAAFQENINTMFVMDNESKILSRRNSEVISMNPSVESNVYLARQISRAQSGCPNNNISVNSQQQINSSGVSDFTSSTPQEFSHSLSLKQKNEFQVSEKERLINTSAVDENEFMDVDYSNTLPMGGDRPYPPALPSKDLYEVTFDGADDKLHPFNWSMKEKTITCAILCLDCITITLGSSIFAPGVTQISEQYDIITVVAILGITLYVLGFAASPVLYAPLSEIYGRKLILVISGFGFALFQFAVATAENLQTIMICRFFSGLIGGAPMAVVPAVFADMFDTNFRGKAICLFSAFVFIGPILGPIMGSYIVQHTSWRWLNYVVGCLASLVFVLLCVFVKESHHATILVNKARKMRKETGNWGIRAAHEDAELSLKEICETTITKPIVLLFTEPVLLVISLYNSFVYGILYLLLEAYPIVFIQGYGLTVNGYLPYLALIVGIIICAGMIWYADTDYSQQVAKQKKLLPERRLYPIIISGIVFPIGILWFCWTGAYPEKIHWICPTIAGSFIGFGLIGIFLPCLNYIIESYLFIAASAVAANTFMRSTFGAVFPLFAGYMFKGMGTGWAGLLIGLFAAAMIPVPFLLLKYGPTIRERSKYAYSE